MPGQPMPTTLRIIHSLLLVCAVAVSPAVLAQAQTSTLEERMSESQFRSFGLDKLTPEELQGLNAWLQGRGVLGATAAAGGSEPPRDDRQGFRTGKGDRDEVRANLIGTFTGWSGKTVFRLDNGQEWQQAEAGAYSGQRFESPEVTIKPKAMGSWLLVVEPCRCRVAVTRIK